MPTRATSLALALALAATGLLSCAAEEARRSAERAPLAVATPIRAPAALSRGVELGAAVALDGDTLAVGAPRDGDASAATGAVYLYGRDAGGAGAWGLVARVVPPGGANGDEFGWSVALSGDLLAVGARRAGGAYDDQGAVHLFGRDQGGPGAWGHLAELVDPTPAAERYFGHAVAVSEGLVAVGVLPLSTSVKGAVQIFSGAGTTWTHAKTLLACGGGTSDRFGTAVALSGALLAVGDPRGRSTGDACVYERDAGGAGAWGLVKELLPTTAGTYAYAFGASVAMAGDLVAVGAPTDLASDVAVGAAYLFARDQGGAGAWGLVTRVLASDRASRDRFGAAVALGGGGTTLAVSAPEDDDGAAESGSIYVFLRDQGGAGTWGQARKLASPSASWNDELGNALAASGTTLAAGARLDDPAGGESGAVTVFERDAGAGGWGAVRQLAAAGGLVAERLEDDVSWGTALAVSGDVAVVGAYRIPVGTRLDVGAAYVARRDATGAWHPAGRLTPPDTAAAGSFGKAVAASGDRILVGAPDSDSSTSSFCGAAYVFRRDAAAADGWTLEARLPCGGDLKFGSTVALDGEVAAVGADFATAESVSVFVRDPASGEWTRQARLASPDPGRDAGFGAGLALSGDVLVAGAPSTDVPATDAGAAYVYLRDRAGAAGWVLAARLGAADAAAGDLFGLAVAADGDVVAVGAQYDDDGGTDTGSVFVYGREVAGPDAFGLVREIQAPPGHVSPNFGTAVALAGDLLLVGAPYARPGGTTVDGAVFVYQRYTGGADAWGLGRTILSPAPVADVWEPGLGRRVASDGATAVVQQGAARIALFHVALAPVDDCPTTNPCLNGGACVDAIDGWACACADGFTGALCDANVDECAVDPGPCLNGGTCADVFGGFECTCVAGWAGATCETNVDDCAPNPCLNGGTCTDGVASFACACAEGWSGPTCAAGDACHPSPCLNGGACALDGAGFACACAAGFAGATCETNVDDCAASPCLNGGACTDGVASFTCACAAGWTGPTCADDVDECAPSPCLNGGACTDGVASFTCACAEGWSGPTCADDVDECAGGLDDCDANATCANAPGGYACACAAGFQGDGRTCTAVQQPGGGGGGGCSSGGVPPAPLAILLALAGWRRRPPRRSVR